MKLVLIFAVLLCVNLHFCRAQNQLMQNQMIVSLIKPSAHLEAANKGEATYQAGQVIKDWSASAPNSHLAGGMIYQEGRLTVPLPGRYYIYTQIYYLNNGRVHIRVNNNIVALTQPPVKGAVSDTGAVYVGGVFNLKGGDVIHLDTGSYPTSTIKIYMYSLHTYFGAYLI